MTEEPLPAAPKKHSHRALVGCGVLIAVAGTVLVAAAVRWLIPDTQVSTMPRAPETPEPEPPPALLVHVRPSVPEVATLLNEAFGAQALMITSLLPYECTLTVDPNEAKTAVLAILRLSVPRSAAALHVLLRAQIEQPTPSGYVVRDVQRMEDGMLEVKMEGPLGPPPDSPAEPVPRSQAPVLGPEILAAVSMHNENGDWTRIATGYLQQSMASETLPPGFNVQDLLSANVLLQFEGVDALNWTITIVCTTRAAAESLRQNLELALADIQEHDALGLVYHRELTVTQRTLSGLLRISGIREAARTVAEAHRASTPPDPDQGGP